MASISALYTYPVKSLAGISHESVELFTPGLAYDRQWMVVDEGGKFLSQRELESMALIAVSIDQSSLKLNYQNKSELNIPLHKASSKLSNVTVWGEACDAIDEGDEAAGWLTEVLGQYNGNPIRLVRMKSGFKRLVDPDYLQGEDAYTGFSDGFPFLIASEESLAYLNSRLIDAGSVSLPMDRFRPNIVIKDVQPFDEDRYTQLNASSGSYQLAIRKPCKRCKITTIDQSSGTISNPKEPLKTLSEMETTHGLKGAYFGQNAILLKGEGGHITVGDKVELV